MVRLLWKLREWWHKSEFPVRVASTFFFFFFFFKVTWGGWLGLWGAWCFYCYLFSYDTGDQCGMSTFKHNLGCLASMILGFACLILYLNICSDSSQAFLSNLPSYFLIILPEKTNCTSWTQVLLMRFVMLFRKSCSKDPISGWIKPPAAELSTMQLLLEEVSTWTHEMQ